MKISQYPATNQVGPNQLFIITAGGTNMNVRGGVFASALAVVPNTNGFSTNQTHYFDQGPATAQFWIVDGGGTAHAVMGFDNTLDGVVVYDFVGGLAEYWMFTTNALVPQRVVRYSDLTANTNYDVIAAGTLVLSNTTASRILATDAQNIVTNLPANDSTWLFNASTNAALTNALSDGGRLLGTNDVTAAGAGIVIHQTGSGGIAVSNTMSAASGENNVNGEISVTNATKVGLVYGKADVTNLLRSVEGGNGITLTNEGTNVVFALTSATLANLAGTGAITNLSSVTNQSVSALGSVVLTNNILYTIGTSNSLGNSGITNFALNFNVAALRIYTTNAFTLTNFSGLEADEGTVEKNVTLSVVVSTVGSVPVTFPTLGGDQYGVHMLTNANNYVQTVLTNSGRHLFNFRAAGTNINVAYTHWQ